MEGRRSPTTESTDIAVEELSRSAQLIKQRPSPIHTLSEAIESFLQKKRNQIPHWLHTNHSSVHTKEQVSLQTLKEQVIPQTLLLPAIPLAKERAPFQDRILN